MLWKFVEQVYNNNLDLAKLGEKVTLEDLRKVYDLDIKYHVLDRRNSILASLSACLGALSRVDLSKECVVITFATWDGINPRDLYHEPITKENIVYVTDKSNLEKLITRIVNSYTKKDLSDMEERFDRLGYREFQTVAILNTGFMAKYGADRPRINSNGSMEYKNALVRGVHDFMHFVDHTPYRLYETNTFKLLNWLNSANNQFKLRKVLSDLLEYAMENAVYSSNVTSLGNSSFVIRDLELLTRFLELTNYMRVSLRRDFSARVKVKFATSSGEILYGVYGIGSFYSMNFVQDLVSAWFRLTKDLSDISSEKGDLSILEFSTTEDLVRNTKLTSKKPLDWDSALKSLLIEKMQEHCGVSVDEFSSREAVLKKKTEHMVITNADFQKKRLDNLLYFLDTFENVDFSSHMLVTVSTGFRKKLTNKGDLVKFLTDEVKYLSKYFEQILDGSEPYNRVVWKVPKDLPTNLENRFGRDDLVYFYYTVTDMMLYLTKFLNENSVISNNSDFVREFYRVYCEAVNNKFLSILNLSYTKVSLSDTFENQATQLLNFIISLGYLFGYMFDKGGDFFLWKVLNAVFSDGDFYTVVDFENYKEVDRFSVKYHEYISYPRLSKVYGIIVNDCLEKGIYKKSFRRFDIAGRFQSVNYRQS